MGRSPGRRPGHTVLGKSVTALPELSRLLSQAERMTLTLPAQRLVGEGRGANVSVLRKMQSLLCLLFETLLIVDKECNLKPDLMSEPI